MTKQTITKLAAGHGSFSATVETYEAMLRRPRAELISAVVAHYVACGCESNGPGNGTKPSHWRAATKAELAIIAAEAAEAAEAMIETTHPDGTPKDSQDIAEQRARLPEVIAARSQRARYMAQYPDCVRRPLFFGPGKAWPLCGVEELRNAVEWANGEPESRHEWQTAEDILSAYRKACAEEQ